jgi:hypothetical protein
MVHGNRKGGTRFSLALLSNMHRDVESMNETFGIMLYESYRARYRWNVILQSEFGQAEAQLALDRLNELRATLGTHLNLS